MPNRTSTSVPQVQLLSSLPEKCGTTAASGRGGVWCIGDPTSLFQEDYLALFCSVRCPGDLILKTYDLARALRDTGVPVIGGFHSPMEKECLRLLLRGRQPVVVCPARGIENMRIPTDWRSPLAEGRLLLLSAFSGSHRRPTAEIAAVRNDFVATLAHRVFIAHAAPGGKTEAFARKILGLGKPLLTLESPANGNLLALGARAVTPEDVRDRGTAHARPI